ncbi:CLIP domain-containing serine protease B9 [Toxorhynchites rutilus septentrionalis]|uniref:CLIP domain-containing serine protease B9 n=1 Tax=Toxorhynchites rutilus septentrionalis TaxID=329112 RepID=UPI00247B2197|nr:CLIP domain-containing serine protease B9 [Toxorhynchites rutilus septentrionalis]
MVLRAMQILTVAAAIVCCCWYSASADSRRSQADYDSGETALLDHYFVRHFDHDGADSETASSYARQSPLNCECVELRYCPRILEMLRSPKSSYSGFNAKLKKLTCERGSGWEPTICCPLDDSWLSDDVAGFEVKGRDNFFGDNLNYLSRNKFRFVSNGNAHKNSFFTSFEDPKTLKNCPPVISSGENYGQGNRAYVAPSVRRRTTTARPSQVGLSDIRASPEPVSIGVTEAPIVATSQRLFASFQPPVLNDALCGLSVNTRIIGGESEIPGQFPWVARLAYRNRTSGRVTYRCAGSLITNRHVITVAHCVTNLIDELELVSVRVGDLECNSITDSRCRSRYQDFGIERLFPHRNYDTPKYANDIAIVKLQLTAETGNIVSPLCLPMNQYSNYARNLTGSLGVIAGWGSTSNRSNTPSPTLQWLRLPIVDTAQCADAYARYSVNSRTPIIVSGNQMCVQGQENRDACQGDSGGPLMNEASSGQDRFVLLGLVSFGPRSCGVSNFPGVYTRISSYIEWISQQIEL